MMVSAEVAMRMVFSIRWRRMLTGERMYAPREAGQSGRRRNTEIQKPRIHSDSFRLAANMGRTLPRMSPPVSKIPQSDGGAPTATQSGRPAPQKDRTRWPLISPNTLERVTLKREQPGIFRRYMSAALAALGATALTYITLPLLGRHSWPFFFGAVAFAAWTGGRRASLLAAAISLLASNYLFMEPAYSLKVGSRADVVFMVMFAVVAAFIGFVISSLRHTRQIAMVRAAELQDQASELEQQVEEAQVLTEELEQTNRTLQETSSRANYAGEEASRVKSHVAAILDSLPDAATAFDQEWRYVYMNRVGAEFLRASGRDPDQALGRPLWEVMNDLTPELRENLTRTIGAAEPTQFESYYAPLDRWFENRTAPTLDGVVVLSRDITGWKRANLEEKFLIEASEALYASLDYRQTLDTVAQLAIKWLADGSAIDIARPDGGSDRIATASRNPASAALAAEIEQRWPLSPDSPYGFPHVIRTGQPEFVSPMTDEVLRAVSQSEEHFEMFRRLDMRSVMTVPLIGRERILGALTFVALGAEARQPFTERDLRTAQELARRATLAIENAQSFQEVQRARAEAEHANRAKMEFLTTMSHELRTPLNAIAGYAELLSLGVRGPVTAQQAEDLGRIQRSQRYLLALINDMLNFAKIETGSVNFNFREVRVAEAMAGMEALIAPQVMAKGLRYHFNCSIDKDVVVTADPDKIQQIILNLLSNAVKFTPADGSITLDCDASDQIVMIRVTDTGPGIPSEKLESVFEPFVQIDRSLTNTGTGVGLGLSISRDLARRMGGDVTVESELGRGASFRFSIPRAR
jgi:signal transduction histidine kinase/PAS domain-containing protein